MKRIAYCLFYLAFPALVFAEWPFGNIGLGVADPKAQLDVSNNIVLHDALLVVPPEIDNDPNHRYHDYSEIIDRIKDDFPPNARGIFWFSGDANDELTGIYLNPDNDGELVCRFRPMFESGENNIGFRSQDGTFCVGKSTVIYDRCEEFGKDCNLNFYDAAEEIWMLLSNGNNTSKPHFKGAALTLHKDGLLNAPIYRQKYFVPMRVFIRTWQGSDYGALAVKVNGKAWFTAAATGDMLLELIWTPPFASETMGRWSLNNAITIGNNTKLNVRSSAVNTGNSDTGIYFNVNSKFQIYDNGDSI